MLKTNLIVNNTCIVRERPCGRIFTGSNTCFVACPSTDEIGLEIDIIKSALLDEEIEPYIAVEHFVAARDIFCTKICTKIIESKFCVVVLSGKTNDDGVVIPIANVYYEYGVMTEWNKYIIPVQRSDQKLDFNIQSLDTIKYTPVNFKTQFEQAVRMGIAYIEKNEDTEEVNKQVDTITLYFELKGLAPHKKTWTVKNTKYMPFDRFNYGTIINHPDEIERIYYETKVIIRRLESYFSDLDIKIKGTRKEFEKANTESQKIGTKKQIDILEKKQLFVKPKFTIVMMQQIENNIIKDSLSKIDSFLIHDINIMSFDQLKEDMKLS